MIAVVNPQIDGVHGIARYLRSFLKNYPSDGPELLVITGERGSPIEAPGNVKFLHLPLSKNRMGLLKWSKNVNQHLRNIAESGELRAINLHIPPLIPALLTKKYAPIIVTAHTTYLGMSGQFYTPRHFKGQWSETSIRIKKMMERHIFSKADMILALTEQGRQEIKSYGYGGGIVVEPNGVDISAFQPNLTPNKTVDVIFAGRIEQRKGSRPMVEVVRKLIEKRPSIKICIVGTGDDASYIRSQLNSFNQVEITGPIPFNEVAARFDQASVYISTSYYEGLPGTCIEAMAMRLPVVVWDFPFYDKLVENGKNGFRVPPNSFDALADAAISLIDSPQRAREFGIVGRTIAENDYSWARLSSRISTVFSEIG